MSFPAGENGAAGLEAFVELTSAEQESDARVEALR
jgi:hypothetical protein